jgi:anti-anti-sigma factor
MLVGCHKRLRDLGGALRIVSNNPNVLRMLAITGLDGVFTVLATSFPEEPVA